MTPSQFSCPVWRRPDRERIVVAPVRSREVVDLVIVGAGFQGLSTALAAARNGLVVRVVEARDIGEGASGLNGGQVIPGLKYDPEWLIARFGEEKGERLIDFASRTADAVFDLIEGEGLDVEYLRNGWIQAAHTHTAMDNAEERTTQWSARGADVTLLNASDIALMTGAHGYLGGWLDRRAGVINPLAFVCELARLAIAAGARIATNETVTDLRQESGAWTVLLSGGHSISARAVLVATNAYSGRLVPGLAQSIVPLHSFQIATAPLSEAQQEIILPHGQAVSDSRRILVYYRKSPDGRLVLGGRGRMSEPQGEEDWDHLRRAMLRIFPDLAGIPVERRWFGRVALTPDHLPHVHEPEKGLLMVAGCQGRGVGLMTAMGPHLATYIETGDRAVLPLPVSAIHPIPLHSLRQIGVAAAIAWYRLLDSLEK